MKSKYAIIPSALLLTLSVLMIATGCSMSRNPLSGRSRAYGYTWQQEISIGREADTQIQAEYGVYDDPEVTRYVDSLGQALVGQSHLRRADSEPEFQATQFFFRVLDSPVVNAFALPGGYVYVTRGLLAHTENEAQLAVILGHEIGHVAGRHGSRAAASQMLGQAILLGGAIGGQVLLGGDVGNSILQLGGTAAQLLFLSYGRDDEREADALGVEYASLTGYDASQGSAFFRTLKRMGEQSGQSLPGFLSTHPDPGEREQTVAQLSADWASRTSAVKVNRDHLLAGLSGMVAGENPRAGFTRSEVFYHPDLALQYPVPSGYQVINQASRVVLLAPDEKAYMTFTIENTATAREAADAFAKTEGLTIVQSGIGSSNGLPANFVVAEAAAEDGRLFKLRAHFVDYGGRVYSFTGITSQASYPAVEPMFIRTMQGFGPLRDRAILDIQPSRIALTRPNRATPFNSLVGESSVAGFTPEELAIMNQIALNQVVAPGWTVKLVR